VHQATEITVSNLDHLGLIAGLVDEIGIVQKINELIGEQPGEIVSPGQAVKAMIINGLGLVSAPLYLFPKFFEGKAIEHLMGEGIQASHLNEYRLGRVLDKLYLAGSSQIFTTIALAAAQKFEIDTETSHLDSSSFHLHGKYESELASVSVIEEETALDRGDRESTKPVSSAVPIKITYGYSRDHRPDLKQFILDLICSSDGDVPLFLRVGSGNESDRAVFASICQEFKQQLNLDSLMVADTALYSAPNLSMLTNLRWLTRVPLSLKQSQQLVSQLNEAEFTSCSVSGYSWSEHKSNYGGIEQRWLVVESRLRRESDLRKLEKKLKKAKAEAENKLQELSKIEFACAADAAAAAHRLSKQLKFYKITQVSSKEITAQTDTNATNAREKSSSKLRFKVQAKLEPDTGALAQETKACGRFILATNVLDAKQLEPDDMIVKYKEQQSAGKRVWILERSAIFYGQCISQVARKNRSFGIGNGFVFVGLYFRSKVTASQFATHQFKIKNQLGKQTNRPTLRWICQIFQSIHLVSLQGIQQISNLTAERMAILNLLPLSCRSYYLLL
jgi:transposase